MLCKFAWLTNLAALTTLEAFVQLGHYLRARPELLDAYVQRTAHHNAWFTVENQWRMLDAIAEDYLSEDKLRAWATPYGIDELGAASAKTASAKTVGLVMAGNLPLVGFHDWLSVLISGHEALVKLSDKDPYLLGHLAKKLGEIEPTMVGRTRFAERLHDFDAVIATGSDNTARYFREYFGKYPHIIRGNRTSVAVLHGNETTEQLRGLADDIFAYFGQGCRSVGKVYVPRDYEMTPLLDVLHEHKSLARHSKWKNNFDYNYALFAINKEPFLMTGSLLVIEREELHSRLATLHYERYDGVANLAIDLHGVRDQLQQVVSVSEVAGGGNGNAGGGAATRFGGLRRRGGRDGLVKRTVSRTGRAQSSMSRMRIA